MSLITAIISSLVAAVAGFLLGKLGRRPRLRIRTLWISFGGRNTEKIQTVRQQLLEEAGAERSNGEGEKPAKYPGLWLDIKNPGEKDIYLEDIRLALYKKKLLIDRQVFLFEVKLRVVDMPLKVTAHAATYAGIVDLDMIARFLEAKHDLAGEYKARVVARDMVGKKYRSKPFYFPVSLVGEWPDPEMSIDNEERHNNTL